MSGQRLVLRCQRTLEDPPAWFYKPSTICKTTAFSAFALQAFSAGSTKASMVDHSIRRSACLSSIVISAAAVQPNHGRARASNGLLFKALILLALLWMPRVFLLLPAAAAAAAAAAVAWLLCFCAATDIFLAIQLTVHRR